MKRGKKEVVLSPFSTHKLDKVWMSIWEEHCTECAVPLCYNQCFVYKKREDGKCSRIKDGIVRNKKYHGLLNYGLECVFEKWGKIESRFYPYSCGVRKYRILSGFNYYVYLLLEFIDKKIGLKASHSLLRKYKLYRNAISLKNDSNHYPDAFILEGHLINKESIQLIIQIDDNVKNQVLYSQIHIIKKGVNHIVVPFH